MKSLSLKLCFSLFFLLVVPSSTIYCRPILGHVTERTAEIVVDTIFNYTVKNLQTGNDYGTGNRMPFAMPYFNMNKVKINDLEPGKTYNIAFFNSKTGKRDTISFNTPKLWAYRTDPPELKISFGSCTFINDSTYDRPGRGYGQSTDIFNAIALQKPDLHIWLGDNWYYREADYSSVEGLKYRVDYSRKNNGSNALDNVPNYAVWDDHDFGPNDSDRSFPLAKKALEIFNSSWGNPPTSSENSYYTSFERDGVEFILLDNRTFRAPNNYPDDSEDKPYFGAAQLQWLKDRLISSKSNFKVICTGGQVLNPSAEFETYARHKLERENLLSFIKEMNIEGVIFLTGDRHYTELTLHPEMPVIDYTSSPLTSGTYEKGCESDNNWKVEGTCFSDNNFGTITFKGKRNERVAVMSCYDINGNLIWEKTWDGKTLK